MLGDLKAAASAGRGGRPQRLPSRCCAPGSNIGGRILTGAAGSVLDLSISVQQRNPLNEKRRGKMEDAMKEQLNLILLLALAIGTLGTTAAAQAPKAIGDRYTARVEFLNFDPGQASDLLRQTDWEHYRRCDGDHDRDDRGCYYSSGAHDRHRYYRGPTGYYDRRGYWHPYGWYDRYGYWHPYR